MLRELQDQFMRHVFKQEEGIAAHIAPHGIFTPAQRLNIYKNNALFGLTDVLVQTFPAVTKLVDEKFMRYAAREFMVQHPPHSGDMNDWGENFPNFLQSFQALAGYPYVTDVARLEWARQESWLSPIKPPADANLLTSAPPETLHLFLQPHARLLRFGYDAVALWSFALEDKEDHQNLGKGDYFALIHRMDQSLFVRNLDKPAHDFLALLHQGSSLAESVDETLSLFPDFALPSFLGHCLRSQLLVNKL